MKDLYRRNDLKYGESDENVLRSQLDRETLDAKAGQYVLLDSGRRAIYDRTLSTVLLLADLRAEFDISSTDHWRGMEDFKRSRRSPPKTSAPNQVPTSGGSSVGGYLVGFIAIVLVIVAVYQGAQDRVRPQRPPASDRLIDFQAPSPKAIVKHVAADQLNVREAPNLESAVVGQLPRYATLTLEEGQIGESWTQVVVNGLSGYVSSDYLGDGSGKDAEIADCRAQGIVRPQTGSIMQRRGSGPHQLIVENAPGRDAIAQLKDRSGAVALKAYVRGGETLTISDVPEGHFKFQFATGSSYSPACDRFLDDMQASSDDEFVAYVKQEAPGGFYTSSMTYTLYRVSNGNFRPQDIPVEQF